MIANPSEKFAAISAIEPWGEEHFPEGLFPRYDACSDNVGDHLKLAIQKNPWGALTLALFTGAVIASMLIPARGSVCGCAE